MGLISTSIDHDIGNTGTFLILVMNGDEINGTDIEDAINRLVKRLYWLVSTIDTAMVLYMGMVLVENDYKTNGTDIEDKSTGKNDYIGWLNY